MSAIDDYLLKSEPLHAVDCALRIPTTMCSCGGDKLAEVARAELAALRQKLAMVESQANLGYATIAEYEAEIGDPPEGSHPDERKPRAATWHQERLNWIDELAALREENARLRAKVEMAEALAEAAAQFECVNLNARLDGEVSDLVTALAAYRSAP